MLPAARTDLGTSGRRAALRAFRLGLRLALALSLIAAGLARVIPVEAPPPAPAEQLQRLGELSRHHLLEVFLGYCPPFQVYTGLGALAAGVFLLFARTILLGALLATADLGMKVVQAYCYPGPAPLIPGLLLLAALTLLAPHLRRLADALLFGRPVEPFPPEPLFADPSRQRALETGIVLLGVLVLLGGAAVDVRRYREAYLPRPPHYGAWTVERWTEGGAEVALDGDPGRWRQMAFEEPGAVLIEDGLGARRRHRLTFDPATGALRLAVAPVALSAPTNLRDPTPPYDGLAFRQMAPNRLILEGTVGGKSVRAELGRMMLYAERFHWVFVPDEEDE